MGRTARVIGALTEEGDILCLKHATEEQVYDDPIYDTDIPAEEPDRCTVCERPIY